MSNDKITLNLSGWPLFITALLCILKLTGIISISWWWCFCLFWLPVALIFAIIGIFLAILIVVVVFGLIVELIDAFKR